MLYSAKCQSFHISLAFPTSGYERERNVLFNDALNTFYLRLYGVRHMVKDHSDSKKGNPLPPHRLLLSINSKVFLYAPSHRQDNTYHGLCYTSRGALAGTRNSSMGTPHEWSIRRPTAPWANALPLSYFSGYEHLKSVFNNLMPFLNQKYRNYVII